MEYNFNEFQVGNWVIYRPEQNYCTIKSFSPYLILDGAIEEYSCTIECIDKIKITPYKLQVCGFDIHSPKFIKSFDDKIYIALVFSSDGVYKLFKTDKEICEVQYIHQVQNAYYTFTGEMFIGNLYGVKEG